MYNKELKKTKFKSEKPNVYVKVLPDDATLYRVRELNKNIEKTVDKELRLLEKHGLSVSEQPSF